MSPAPERSPKGNLEFGQAGAEIVYFGVVLFTAMVLVVVNAWGVVDTKFMVTSAAREGTRAYVEADAEPMMAARTAARNVFTSYRPKTGATGKLIPIRTPTGRCERVVLRASFQVPALKIPVFGISVGRRTVSATHSELIDPFRSGLEGEAGGECVG